MFKTIVTNIICLSHYNCCVASLVMGQQFNWLQRYEHSDDYIKVILFTLCQTRMTGNSNHLGSVQTQAKLGIGTTLAFGRANSFLFFGFCVKKLKQCMNPLWEKKNNSQGPAISWRRSDHTDLNIELLHYRFFSKQPQLIIIIIIIT